jgi:hypothetical protein
MKMKKHMHPDAEPATGGSGSGKPVKTRNIPEADVDFMDLAKNVATNWLANPAITLVWKVAADFQKEVNAYETELTSRKSAGSVLPGQALTLKQMDRQIDVAVSDVKIYIQRKFKKANAEAQYARYGITRQNKSFIISRDRNNRRDALKLMITAIDADGFAGEEYGTAFWTGMQTNYSAAIDAAGTTAGNVSTQVAGKNKLKGNIKTVLNSLLLVLKGNYPETYPGVYRDWGWQKERL